MPKVLNKEDIFDALRAHRAQLDELHVVSLSLFGSFARDEQTPESDVDFIVEYGELVGLPHHVKTQFFLRDILGRQVDLATDESLHPRMRDDILAEAIKAA